MADRNDNGAGAQRPRLVRTTAALLQYTGICAAGRSNPCGANCVCQREISRCSRRGHQVPRPMRRRDATSHPRKESLGQDGRGDRACHDSEIADGVGWNLLQRDGLHRHPRIAMRTPRTIAGYAIADRSPASAPREIPMASRANCRSSHQPMAASGRAGKRTECRQPVGIHGSH